MNSSWILPRAARWFVALALGLCSVAASAAPEALSDDECEAYAAQIVGQLQAGNPEAVIKEFDFATLVNRALRGLDVKDTDKADFQKGVSQSMPAALAHSLKQFSHFRFVRLQHVDGDKRILVRCLDDEGAMNFIALVCQRRLNGKPKWVDFHSYITGELTSATLRRAALALVQKQGLLERLSAGEHLYVKHASAIMDGNEKLRRGEFRAALDVFNKLPPALKREKFVLPSRLAAAQNINEEEYAAVIKDWEEAYPGDASLNLVSIDGAAMRKDFPAVIKHLLALDQAVGGDGHVTLMTAQFYKLTDRPEEAKKVGEKALALEPTLASGYDLLLTMALEKKDFPEVASVCERAEKVLNADMVAAIADDESFAEFRASEAYKAWLARRSQPGEKAAAPRTE